MRACIAVGVVLWTATGAWGQSAEDVAQLKREVAALKGSGAVVAKKPNFSARFSASLASFACSFPFFPCCASLASFFVSATVLRIAPFSSSSSRWAYQTSIVGIWAKSAMASR